MSTEDTATDGPLQQWEHPSSLSDGRYPRRVKVGTTVDGDPIFETHLGEGRVQVEPGDPRYCPLYLDGSVHEPHQHTYAYHRGTETGITTGRYDCA